MKRYIFGALAALAVCACAKEPAEGINDDAKFYLDSWIQVHHPGAVRTALGAYVLGETPGSGAAVGTEDVSPYVRVDYTASNLDGTIVSTTDEALVKQLGQYTSGNYYGPAVWDRDLAVGLDEALSAMRVGGTRTFVLPGWLQTGEEYSSAEDYLNNVSGGSPIIYELKVREAIPDIRKWETDSIGRYIPRMFPGKTVRDSLKYGLYYFRTGAPSSETDFPADTTIYINYVGRLLNGTVFDTNVKDSAKFYGIYSASRTYAPSSVTFSKGDDDEITVKMGGSSVITGFSETLMKMHPYEKGSGVFYSSYGYAASGSGSTIPAYSPLRFDIEVVDKP